MSESYIVLVDDEDNILNALQRELHDWAKARGLSILTFHTAMEALDALGQKGPSTKLVISDLKMPEMKGSDFLMRVKEAYPDIVSILLTGFSETEEVVKAVRAGIFSYVLKPWDRKYLLAEIEKALSYYELNFANRQRAKTVDEELRWAGEMQRTLLRPNLPNSDGVEFRASYRPLPSMHCGGDYYDVIFLGTGRFLILLGDVAGHGIRAAFITGILKAVIYPEYIRPLSGKAFAPGDFLSWLNERVNFELRSTSGVIITFFAGLLDLKERYFRYANAGQPHPLLVRGGQSEALPVSGSALGAAKNIQYAEQTINLLPQDTLLFYTDGLYEIGEGDAGPKTIKIKGIIDRLPYSPDYHKKIMQEALKAAGSADFTDDLTVVTARING
jgi:sigma-B regulation protein RsbU (phosphoserine phosphatase)